MTRLDSLLQAVQKQLPKAKIVAKEDSLLMKVIAKLMFFNPDFMDSYITTIGYTSYFPKAMLTSAMSDDDNTATFAHEQVHMHDYKNSKFFSLGYLMPQLLAALASVSLLAIWFSKLWLLNLLWLGMLAPIPAYWRMKDELRGYTMSLAYAFWEEGQWDPYEDANFVSNFTGSGYYFMWPFEKDMEKRKSAAKVAIEHGNLLTDPAFKLVYDWISATDGPSATDPMPAPPAPKAA